ncbi:uncharacterized protein LOC131629101 isoform X2 [Vicia villosa]|uniref:uncharacterized protein LOC131629101 isoform X2 n=1 Tax=Vicia villosa TaxID=3911 RepID=UPI00273C072D|nr:uncharacterized protein LOC131629101 isoform X2 [Vicia villosa]
MTSFFIDWAKKCLEKLINRAIAEARFVVCFTCIAKEFEKERAGLEVERITLEQRTEVAIRRNKDIQANVGVWKEDVDRLIKENAKIKPTCFLGFCPDCIGRYKKGKELANNTEEIKRLIEKGEKFGNIELPRRLPDVERYSSQDYISFKSRESEYKELLDTLKDDNNYITQLQGMGGTGKTTLAKNVGKELKEYGQFIHVIDTTVSFTPDIKKIQDDIAGPLGLEWEGCNESDRAGKLWDRLTNGEKILLIMDDVWDQHPFLDFDAIGIPKRDQHKGCRVLVTTRSKQLMNKMNFDKSVELKLLSEDDAWIMFKRYANISNSSSKNVIGKGRKIAKECKQLPVAIAVTASTLKGQQHRVHEWDVRLKALKKPVSVHGVDDDMVGIYKCLKYSYDYMKDEKAKELFLLCSVFREDEEISIEFLTRLSIGAGLFGEDCDFYNEARDLVAVSKNKLLDSCLLLEVDGNRVKMHDLVRDVAQWIAKKEIQAVNLSNRNQKSLDEREANIKYLLCEGSDMDLFSCKFDGSKLETLILNVHGDEDHGCMEVPNSFFENIVKLRVLVLLSNNERSLSLPNSIQSLTNIRSLMVHMVDLGDISVLGNLQSLESLDLSQCKINELPSEIAELQKLKLLNLEDCEIRMNNPFTVIESCSSLEELYFSNSFNGFCQVLTLPELQRYHIHNEWDDMDDSLSKYVVFRGDDDTDYFSNEAFKYFMQTANDLRLSGIKRMWRNIMPEIVPIDHGMNDLIVLKLEDDSQLQFLIDNKHTGSQVTDVFSKLVKLELCEMEKLEELCNGPIFLDFMANLEKISIDHCENLRSLFKCSLNLCSLKTVKLKSCSALVSVFELSTSQSLPLLENLKISDCEKLENIISFERRADDTIEEIVDGDNDDKSCYSMFPKLKVLKIDRCPKLQFILPFISVQDFLLLEVIKIIRCHELKYIFSQHQDVKLTSLKQVGIGGLPNFIDICPAMPSSISKDGSKPQTQRDPIKSNIFSWSTNMCCYKYKLSTKIPLVSEDQPQGCSISLEPNPYFLNIWERAQCLSRHSHFLCNVKVIGLYAISKIKSVFILSSAPIMLETLTIEKCDELKHIVIDTGDHDSTCGNNLGNVFQKLKELSVEDCIQLEYIFGHYTDDHQNHGEINLNLPALEVLDFQNLQSFMAMSPKQCRTTFPTLARFNLIECSRATIKSIGDFLTHHSVTEFVDNTIIKEVSRNMEHSLALEKLCVLNSKVENIFLLDEENGQQLNFGLQEIELCNLPEMICLFVGPKNTFALTNLTWIEIVQCEKLEILFSVSTLRCLPQLFKIRIEECGELKYIIEDDLVNKKSSNTCFPKLKSLAIVKCNKLKCIFPISIGKELPGLKALIIREAGELKDIFKGEVEIPNLNYVVFVNLPSLFHAQGIQFQAVNYRFVQNCQELSMTSTSTNEPIDYDLDYKMREDLGILFEKTQLVSEGIVAEIEVEAASRQELKSLQELINEQSMDLQHPLGETDATVKPSELEGSTISEKTVAENLSTVSETKNESPIQKGIEISVEEVTKSTTDVTAKTSSTPLELDIEISVEQGATSIKSKTIASSTQLELVNEKSMDQQGPLRETDATVKPSEINNLEGSTISEKTVAENLSTISETKNESPVQKGIEISVEKVTKSTTDVKAKTSSTPLELGIEICVEEGTTLKDAKTKSSSSSHEDGDSQIVLNSISIATTETNDQVSLNDDVAVKVSSIVEQQFSKEDDKIVSKTRPFSIASQFPSMPSKGDPSQKVEELSSSLLVTRELEQLVSKKHLDYENLSLLTDFLVKHPSVLLRDTSLSNRYKGYAYNCLAELLKFLQTHSVLDVLGSSHTEFIELLQDVRKCGFAKEWLDVVEKRVLFPGLHVSQDALQKLWNSNHILTQQVEDLKQQLASSKAVLESIIQQDPQILETSASLSDPIGY